MKKRISLFTIFSLIFICFIVKAKEPYIDIIIPNQFLGDNIIHHFPRIAAAKEWCKRQRPPCTPRVWMPENMKRMFQNTGKNIVFKTFEPYRAGEYARTMEDFIEYNREYLKYIDIKNSRGVWLSPNESTGTTEIYHALIKEGIEAETNKPVRYLMESQGSQDQLRPKYDPKEKGWYKKSKANFKKGIPGMDGLEITDENVTRWRKEVAEMLCPENRKELVRHTIKKHFPGRQSKASIFLNLNTSKPQTTLFKNGRAKQLLNELIKKHGKNANIIIGNMDELLRHTDFASSPEIMKEIRDFIKYVDDLNMPGVKILPGSTKNYFSVVDSFLADPHTLVVTTDTGPYHLAAALKDDPDKVVSIFHKAKASGQANVRKFSVGTAESTIADWGAPNARNIALDSLPDKQILSSADPTIQRKLGQIYKDKFLKRIVKVCK